MDAEENSSDCETVVDAEENSAAVRLLWMQMENSAAVRLLWMQRRTVLTDAEETVVDGRGEKCCCETVFGCRGEQC